MNSIISIKNEFRFQLNFFNQSFLLGLGKKKKKGTEHWQQCMTTSVTRSYTRVDRVSPKTAKPGVRGGHRPTTLPNSRGGAHEAHCSRTRGSSQKGATRLYLTHHNEHVRLPSFISRTDCLATSLCLYYYPVDNLFVLPVYNNSDHFPILWKFFECVFVLLIFTLPILNSFLFHFEW